MQGHRDGTSDDTRPNQPPLASTRSVDSLTGNNHTAGQQEQQNQPKTQQPTFVLNSSMILSISWAIRPSAPRERLRAWEYSVSSLAVLSQSKATFAMEGMFMQFQEEALRKEMTCTAR